MKGKQSIWMEKSGQANTEALVTKIKPKKSRFLNQSVNN